MKTTTISNALIDLCIEEKAKKEGFKMIKDYKKVIKKKPEYVAYSVDKKTMFISHVSQKKANESRDKFDKKNSVYFKLR